MREHRQTSDCPKAHHFRPCSYKKRGHGHKAAGQSPVQPYLTVVAALKAFKIAVRCEAKTRCSWGSSET